MHVILHIMWETMEMYEKKRDECINENCIMIIKHRHMYINIFSYTHHPWWQWSEKLTDSFIFIWKFSFQTMVLWIFTVSSYIWNSRLTFFSIKSCHNTVNISLTILSIFLMSWKEKAGYEKEKGKSQSMMKDMKNLNKKKFLPQGELIYIHNDGSYDEKEKGEGRRVSDMQIFGILK